MASSTQNRTDTKWLTEKIDLQIPSLRSQPSEGSAAHPVILPADNAMLLERSYQLRSMMTDKEIN